MTVAELGRGSLFAGRYELRELLIRTSRGPAYLVHDRDIDVEVVLVLFEDEGVLEGEIEQLRRHVRMARRVTHHNVARTFDMGEHGGRHFVTVEYIDGLRLPEWLARDPSASERYDAAAQITEGLAVAHAAGILHGNIVPNNILVEVKGRAVLGNFGLPQFEAADTVGLEGHAGDLSRSVRYLAPEQVRGDVLSEAVDIYSVGLLVYEMCVGVSRYAGDNPMQVANTRLTDALDDLREGAARDERLSAPLARLLLRCFDPEPRARPSAVELGARLRELAHEHEHEHDSAQASGAPLAAHASRLGNTQLRRCDSLAVLPFRFRGPSDSGYLAEALVDELVDLLSQTGGMRVFGSGATARYTGAAERDPKQIGAELGVDVLVDGTMMVAGDRLRISARLIEVAEGFQLWHERFEGSVADVFELQDKLAKRIAEALRVELEVVAHRGNIDPEAVESFLRGRQAHLRWRVTGEEGALAHYRAALERAPEFKPALAHLAAATVLAWFLPRDAASTIDWEQAAKQTVAHAMAVAPELPESRLAASNLAAQLGNYYDAALELSEAVRIAPTFALGREFLGRMMIETGYAERGAKQLELAAELDPALTYCYADIARQLALMGDMEGFAANTAPLLARIDEHLPSTGMLYVRVGLWFEHEEMVREGIAWLERAGEAMRSTVAFAELLLASDTPRELLDAQHRRSLDSAQSPRLAALVGQFGAELYARHGHRERSLECLEQAADAGLVDLVWLEHCPFLAPLREEARFAVVQAALRERARAIGLALGLASRF